MAGILDSETGWLIVTNLLMGTVLIVPLVVAFTAIQEIIGKHRAAH